MTLYALCFLSYSLGCIIVILSIYFALVLWSWPYDETVCICQVCGCTLWKCVRACACQYPCILFLMPIFVALYMISALRALWACVDVVCVFVGVGGCLEQAWGRFGGPACCGVAWPSSKALWLVNFYGESSAAQTFQCRPSRCTTQTHTCQTHTASAAAAAFIRSATSSQACSLTLQRALSLSLSLSPHPTVVSFFHFWSLFSSSVPLWLSFLFFLSVLPFLLVHFPLFFHDDISFTWLNVESKTPNQFCVIF